MENSAAYTTTPSNPPFRWLGEPKQRGTLGIFSLCFSTSIICVWSALHFNVPIKRYTNTRRFFYHVSWMFMALFVPELLLFLATNERINASILLKEVRKIHPRPAKPGKRARMYNWIRGRAESKDTHFQLVHAFYATMGGFAFDRFDGASENIVPDRGSNPGQPHNIRGALQLSYPADMLEGSPTPTDGDPPKSLFGVSANPCCNVVVLRYDALMYIMKHFPRIITDITEEEILDRAASSSLSKALLVVQVAWFCTNCISRLIQGLQLSLLEVSTVARAICALLTYILWWPKPINVAAPTLLRGKEAREAYALLRCSDEEYDNALEMAQKRAAGDSSMPTGPHGSEKMSLAADALQHLPTPERPPRPSVLNNSDHMLFPGTLASRTRNGEILGNIAVAISPILYGFPHFLAWNGQFPTSLERLLWRVSSIAVTFSGLVGISAGWLSVWTYGRYGNYASVFTSPGIVIASVMAPVAYGFGSFFLIFESVRQLFFLDDAVYQLPVWSYYWPHLT